MAQAKYVNNAIRARLTAAGAKSSTNPVGAADSDLLIARLAGHKGGRSTLILIPSTSRSAPIRWRTCSARSRPF